MNMRKSDIYYQIADLETAGRRYWCVFCQLRVPGCRKRASGFGWLPMPGAIDAENIWQLRRLTIEGLKKGWSSAADDALRDGRIPVEANGMG